MLYSYKMTDDSGFAPNPFFKIMTLATCKPQIRESKKLGVYIAGFTSNDLCNEKVGFERMVFIMKVTAKIDFNTYYHDQEYRCKRPSPESRITKSGDNIYHTINGKYIQERNFFHKQKNIEHDLKSNMVLISKNFFYFGSGAIPINQFKIKVPTFQSSQGYCTDDRKEISRLWNFLENNYNKNCLINPPHFWDENEPFN
jgi:hypothetical protein